MKILYVYGKASTRDVVKVMRKLKYTLEEYSEKQENSVLNDEMIERLKKYIVTHKITHLMTISLIYNVAMAAYETGIKYISIIWDSPYIKLYTPFGRMENCWFSVFDKLDYKEFKETGISHIIYQPLSVCKSDVVKWDVKRRLNGKYTEDVAFVGSIYDNNPYDLSMGGFPPEIHNYFSSIFEEAAFKWDGINRVYGKTSKEMLRYMELINPDFKLDNPYDISDERYFETVFLTRKIANIERTCVLNMLAEYFHVSFYTNSTEDHSQLVNVDVKPPVEVGEAASYVYAGTKINLNISIKGIEGGTPQRIMEIMGAGGFMLTNYCVETLELFEENKEIVTFKTPEELVEKTAYYLEHDKEREQIAEAGRRKVLQCYTYEKKLKQLMDWVEG